MDILNEIIELSNEMVDLLSETGFFEENPFIERLPLKRKLQIAMQRKWEQEDEMHLTDVECEAVLKQTMEESINLTIEDLVEKGALDISVDQNGEMLYSANKDFKWDEDEF
jgi:hypothetical protein